MTVAEGATAMLSIMDTPMLQWGRNLTVAEGMLMERYEEVDAGLQWGRNLTVAEGWSRTARSSSGR